VRKRQEKYVEHPDQRSRRAVDPAAHEQARSPVLQLPEHKGPVPAIVAPEVGIAAVEGTPGVLVCGLMEHEGPCWLHYRDAPPRFGAHSLRPQPHEVAYLEGWMDRLSILRASRETRVGKYLMRTDPFPGKAFGLRRLRRRGIRVVGRLSHVDESRVGFAGGEMAEVDAVLWATGYHDDGKWVTIPEVKDASGGFVHQRGVSPTPDLYLMGRSWQWTRGSALLTGVGDDAAYVASRIAERLPPRQFQPRPVSVGGR
jgi:hypothetical protein